MGLTKTEFYQEELNYLASILQVLGHPARLSIIYYLKQHVSATVGELAYAIPLAQSTISEHIKVLKKRVLIRGVQSGTSIRYSLHEQVWPVLKEVLRDCAEDL